LQLLASPIFASEENIATKQSATQQIEKLKEHIPVADVQKIILDYVGNEYLPTKFDQVNKISATAQSSNGKYLMIASRIRDDISNKQDAAKVWKFENGKYILIGDIVFPITAYENGAAAISDDGKYVAMSARHGNIHIGQLENGKYIEKQIVRTPEKPRGLQFFENHNYLGFGTSSARINVLKLFQINRFNPKQIFGEKFVSDFAAFSSDGTYVVSAESKAIQLWKTINGQFTPINKLEIGQYLYPIAISHDNKYVVAATNDFAEIFRLQDDKLEPIQKMEFGSRTQLIKFSPDSTHLAIATYDSKKSWQTLIIIMKFNQKSRKYEQIATLPHEDFHKDPYQLIGFSPDNAVITATVKDEITLWKNEKEQLEQDTGEKIKSANAQEQTVVTEVD